ncbi:MAG: P-loop NTPase fold protein [Anaerolineales bacterium]|nr:MAG: P-loop NTPase fold protein [Anaerolineales bacterium]
MAKKKDLLAIFSDKPARKDLLNFKDYSNLLANVITNSETPSTIGIFGEWGSGKTSLMLMIEELLQKKGIKTIWFNAWKYDKEEALWRALILSIVRGLNTGQKEIDDTTLKLYEAVSTEKLGQVQIDWIEIGKTLMKGAAFLVAPLFLIPGIANAFANASFLDQVSDAFTRRKIQQSRERISSIEQFEEYYKQLVSKHISGDERIVILIDDLDRCVPVRSLDVLEALKSFLDATGCVYVVACDTRLINQGLLEKYDNKSGIHVDEYLAKIVQFSFAIPPIRVEDAEKFIKNFGLSVDSLEIRRLIATTIERNPRKLKRFLSDLTIKTQLVKTRKLLLKPENLVKMSCIALAWKEFWQATLKDVTVFTRAQNIAMSEKGVEKSPDDIEFEKIFHIDNRLQELLRTAPSVTDADLHEYIFLSTATSLGSFKSSFTDDAQSKATTRGLSSSEIGDIVISDKQKAILSNVIKAIRQNEFLISIKGMPGSGKTTLLRVLENTESGDFVAVYVRMDGILKYVAPELVNWMIELGRRISQELSQKGFQVRFQFDENNFSILNFIKFLSEATFAIKNRQLLIMLDEYDAMPSSARDIFDDQFIQVFDPVFSTNPKITVIVCGRELRYTDKSPMQMANLAINISETTIEDFAQEYERIISLPTTDYDHGEAFRLLFLFENELRHLISNQFNKKDWWQQGVPQDLYFKAKYRIGNMENVGERLSVFSLGELFKIILSSDNWDRFFNEIFGDRNALLAKSSLIVKARNSIAHSRTLSLYEMEQLVSSVKELLEIVHNQNLKA